MKNFFIYRFYTLRKIKSVVRLSFSQNQEISPEFRVFNQKCFFQNPYSGYRAFTRRKLRCFFTLNKSVPSKKWLVSRFYLVKYADGLKLAGLRK